MVSRENLLQAVEDDNCDSLIELVLKHKNCRENFNLRELLSTFSKTQIDGLWDVLQLKCTTALLEFQVEEDERRGDVCEEFQYTMNIFDAIVVFAFETISLEEVYVPANLLSTIIILHGILLNLPDAKLQNSLSSLCERWWMKDLTGKEELSAQTILYLLEASLSENASINMVKRVWQIRGCLQHINLNNLSSATLKTILLNCYTSSLYLKKEQGRKFLSLLFGLDLSFIEDIHKTIKGQIPTVSKSVLSFYGDIYFRAWRNASGETLKTIEEKCIQDFIYHGVNVQRGGSMSMAARLQQVLHVFHRHKLQQGIDEMLLRLYNPILWRSLNVANPHIRANALELLIDVFPLANPANNVEEADILMQKQFDAINTLLNDPVPLLRLTAVQGISHICNVYWEMLPLATIKSFITKLAHQLAWDGASADVRTAVVKGFGDLVDNRLTHPLLKTLLPELSNLLHDVSEKVRIAFLNLLLKIKNIKAIQFWTIAPPEQLLARLEEDSPSVAKRIVSLLVTSYFPVDKDNEEVLNRTIILIKSNPAAARRFYQFAAQDHIAPVATAKLLTLICRCIMQCVKTEAEQNADITIEDDIIESFEEDNESFKQSPRNHRRAAKKSDSRTNDESEENEADDDEGDEGTVSLRDTELMCNLLDVCVILWMTVGTTLKEKRFASLLLLLHKRFGVALPQFMKVFNTKRAVASIIMLAGFLPSNIIPTLSISLRSKLKAMSIENKQEDYSAMLECMCNWGKISDLFELITEWLEAGFASHDKDETAKTSRKRSVTFEVPDSPQPMLALAYLSYICQDFVCREALISKRTAAIGVCKTLKRCIKCLEVRFKSSEELSELATDQFLLKSFEQYLKLEVILHKKENKKNSTLQILDELITWVDCEVLALFKNKPAAAGGRKKGRRLMMQADTTLLADPDCLADDNEGSKTLSATAVTFSETLLSETVLGKRTLGDSNQENILNLAENVLQAFFVSVSEMLLVGIADNELVTHMADLAIETLQIDSTKFLPLIAKLMYQITELTLYAEEEEIDEGLEGQGDIVSGMLNKVVQMLALLVKNKKEQAERVLPTIKLAFTEVLSSYYRHLSFNQTVNKDLISTVMNACLAEVASTIKKDQEFEPCEAISQLPTLSAFLLGLLHSRKDMLVLFVGELRDCVETGTCDNQYKIGAAIHIINTLSKGKLTIKDVEDCVKEIHSQLETITLPEELSEESALRHLQKNNIDVLRECMNSLGLVV